MGVIKFNPTFSGGTPIDMNEYFNRLEQERKEADERAKIAAEIESERIENMTCPVCKSNQKKHYVKSNNNGVYGPGSYSWITDDYYICLECGVHYSDINKAK